MKVCWVSLFLAVIVLASTVNAGGIMGKGLSAGMSRGNKNGGKSHRRKSAKDFIDDMKRLDEDDDGLGGSNRNATDKDGDEPCIGLCYYQKVLEQEQSSTLAPAPKQSDPHKQSGVGDVSVVSPTSGGKQEWVLEKAYMPFPTGGGCVGLCYYYQKKGDMSTYRKIMKKFRIQRKSQLSTRRPCVGICQYYRRMGIKDPYLSSKNQA